MKALSFKIQIISYSNSNKMSSMIIYLTFQDVFTNYCFRYTQTYIHKYINIRRVPREDFSILIYPEIMNIIELQSNIMISSRNNTPFLEKLNKNIKNQQVREKKILKRQNFLRNQI